MTRYYALNFIRKPEFMGFNGYNDGINRTAFNPLAWPSDGEPDQNHARATAWSHLRNDEQAIAKSVPPQYASAFFELVGYPIEGAAAMNEKFLATDLTYLDAAQLNPEARQSDTERARNAYNEVQSLTGRYNALEGGKWDGIMSAAPRQRHVFEMPRTATDADTTRPLPQPGPPTIRPQSSTRLHRRPVSTRSMRPCRSTPHTSRASPMARPPNGTCWPTSASPATP